MSDGRFSRAIAITQPGMFLSQPGIGDERVVPLRAHDRLDRVGDEVARRQRVAHAVGAHRDAVADADGVEAHARPGPPPATPSLTCAGQPIEVHVARVALVPHAADADLRLLQIGVGQAGAVQHRLRRPLAARLRDPRAVSCSAPCHSRPLPDRTAHRAGSGASPDRGTASSPRSRAPTTSIGCVAILSRSRLEVRQPASFSAIQFLANSPDWMSLRICFIAFFVSSVTICGPAV